MPQDRLDYIENMLSCTHTELIQDVKSKSTRHAVSQPYNFQHISVCNDDKLLIQGTHGIILLHFLCLLHLRILCIHVDHLRREHA